MTRTLLVDGDIVVYKAAFGAEQTFQFDDDQWVTTADLSIAKANADSLLVKLQEVVKADAMIVCLSDQTANWRKAIYPEYKAQRKKTRRPVLLGPLREYLTETYTVYERPTLEADDVLGILATSQAIPGDKIIVTIDKDLLQIPGKHLNIDSLKKSVVTVEQGDYQHALQTLTGDVVDNYPGCPGVGPVKAAAILNVRETHPTGADPIPYMVKRYWRAIVETFSAKGLSYDDALTQARVARICRVSDYDFVSKQPRLWTPPNG